MKLSSVVPKELLKYLSQLEVRATILVIPIGKNNTQYVWDVELLLPVKFHQILFSGFREEAEKPQPKWVQGSHIGL